MGWTRAHRKDEAALWEFLGAHEETTVNATTLCVHPSGFRIPQGPCDTLFVYKANHSVQAVVAFKGRSLVIPILQDPRDRIPKPIPQDILAELTPLIQKNTGRYFTLMGPRRWVEPNEVLIATTPYQKVLYDLMVWRGGRSDFEVPAGFEIRRVSTRDADELLGLQGEYEKEEVLFSPLDYNLEVSRHFFLKILGKELVLALYRDGRPVAKGGTNATGFKMVQIGGVYTHPEERNRGRARVLMLALLKTIEARDLGACLFVKKTNLAARRLYESLDFEVREDFCLSYFQK